MNITLGELKQLLTGQPADATSATPAEPSCVVGPWEIGRVYLIRTVTMINAGKVVQVTGQEIVLEEAAWIADTGRFADALKTGNFNEVEPWPDGQVIIGRGSVVDACKITPFQRSQK